MTPTQIKIAALLRRWRGDRSIPILARACEVSYSCLRSQLQGVSPPTAEVLLAVGRELRRPPAEVSLAVSELVGDGGAVELWRAVLGPAEGRAVGVLRVLGLEADADLLASARGAPRTALDDDPQLEADAERIYNEWRSVADFRPWVPGGNSRKQDEARALARERKGEG